MLSYHVFELYKKISSQDGLRSIMNNRHSMKYLSLSWYTSCEVEWVIKICILCSLRGSVSFPNLEDEIHFKGVDL